jgi:hypothetical protein
LIVIAGCTTTGSKPNPTMQITFLGTASCPNTPALRANLRQALDDLGMRKGFQDVDQDRLPEGDPLRRFPTPTILVNGRDLYGLQPSEHDALGCRIYRHGFPTSAEIARLLSQQSHSEN